MPEGSKLPEAMTASVDDYVLGLQEDLTTPTGYATKRIKLSVISDSVPPGPQGPTGNTGPAGAPGSVIYSGLGAPGAGTGTDGDWYLNSGNGDVYRKLAGAWVFQMNIVGPSGPPAGNDGDVQFNDAGVLGANPNFTFNDATNILSVDNATLRVTDLGTISGNVALDFNSAGYQICDLSGDVTFSSLNLAAGRTIAVRITCDGSDRNLSFPATWVFIGAAGVPASIAASKRGLLSLTSFAANDANVMAAWGVEP